MVHTAAAATPFEKVRIINTFSRAREYCPLIIVIYASSREKKKATREYNFSSNIYLV